MVYIGAGSVEIPSTNSLTEVGFTLFDTHHKNLCSQPYSQNSVLVVDTWYVHFPAKCNVSRLFRTTHRRMLTTVTFYTSTLCDAMINTLRGESAFAYAT